MTTYAAGDFSFLDTNTAVMLSDIYETVSKLNLWEKMKDFIPGDGGYSFGENPGWVSEILNGISYTGHSGSSGSMCFTHMDFIAKYGWENYVLKLTKNDEETKLRFQIMELPGKIQRAEKCLADLQRKYGDNPNTLWLIKQASDKVVSLNNELKSLDY